MHKLTENGKKEENKAWDNWDKQKILNFQQTFLAWYEQEKRLLPWRENRDPYRIWISEIMLQQTQVDTVIHYFNRFMEKFPTLEKLAEAEDEVLLKSWEGLGYYSRARNLKVAANQIMEEYNGIFPQEVEKIQSLKGIGPYTSGAIASIAFDLLEPAIDGNVMRVMSRLFEISLDISIANSRKTFDEVVRKLISPTFPGEFNQAIMDLGATVCTPVNPLCERCPISSFCQSYEKGTQNNFPVKTKKIRQKPVYYMAIAVKNSLNEYYFEQRNNVGLLANMWTFPLIEVNKEEYERLKKLPLKDLVPLGEMTQLFTHLKWYVQVFQKSSIEHLKGSKNARWVKASEVHQLVLPKLQMKINELLGIG
jgi:A/G-specific adenine glycosylase